MNNEKPSHYMSMLGTEQLAKTLLRVINCIFFRNQILGVAAVDLALNQLYDRFVQAYQQCESESGEYM